MKLRSAGVRRSLILIIAFPATMIAQSFRVVGHSDLGGEGLNGDVTVVGSTAIVAAGLMPAGGVHAHLYNPYPCPAVSVKLVDHSVPGPDGVRLLVMGKVNHGGAG